MVQGLRFKCLQGYMGICWYTWANFSLGFRGSGLDFVQASGQGFFGLEVEFRRRNSGLRV